MIDGVGMSLNDILKQISLDGKLVFIILATLVFTKAKYIEQ